MIIKSKKQKIIKKNFIILQLHSVSVYVLTHQLVLHDKYK